MAPRRPTSSPTTPAARPGARWDQDPASAASSAPSRASRAGCGVWRSRARTSTQSGEFINVYNGLTPIDAADKVAKWNGSSWSALGNSSFFGELGTATPYDVVVDGSRVIVVGAFLNAGGKAKADGIATFSGGSWSNVGTDAAGTNGPTSSLRDVAIVGSKLYVGGLSPAIGGGVRNDFVAFYRLRQPDATIATTGAAAGNDVYNTTGASQAKSRSVPQGGSGSFLIKVTNDGLGADSYTVKGPGSGSGFSVKYMVGSTDITAAVVAGTFTVSGLSAGASRTITLKVTVGGSVPNGASRSWLVTATSTGAGSCQGRREGHRHRQLRRACAGAASAAAAVVVRIIHAPQPATTTESGMALGGLMTKNGGMADRTAVATMAIEIPPGRRARGGSRSERQPADGEAPVADHGADDQHARGRRNGDDIGRRAGQPRHGECFEPEVPGQQHRPDDGGTNAHDAQRAAFARLPRVRHQKHQQQPDEDREMADRSGHEQRVRLRGGAGIAIRLVDERGHHELVDGHQDPDQQQERARCPGER